jgi:flavin reductase (DIM6/NTAB) family NADH-FMN oxidoreductase RutF
VRVELEPVDANEFYRFLNSVVIPRPIAWVSTRSVAGVDNLAPHSFFTVASVTPPVVQFTSVGRKDSLNNVEATGEFVVNLAPEWLYEQINATGTAFPSTHSEFDEVGIEREPSRLVTPPRVAGSPVVLECVRHDVIAVGDCWIVLGRVVHAAIDEFALEDGRPQADRLAPLARLGGNEWATLGDISKLTRIPYENWPGHYRHRPADRDTE